MRTSVDLDVGTIHTDDDTDCILTKQELLEIATQLCQTFY